MPFSSFVFWRSSSPSYGEVAPFFGILEKRRDSFLLLPKRNRNEWDLLPLEKLESVCFAPLIEEYKRRMTDSSSVSSSDGIKAFFRELTKGQQGLFSFQVYFLHAIQSFEEFYWWSAYFVAQPQRWMAISAGLHDFEDEEMQALLGEVENVLVTFHHPISLEGFQVTREELGQNAKLREAIGPLHDRFRQQAPSTLFRIRTYIRAHPHEFLTFDD